MQRFKAPVLFAALLGAGVLHAQAANDAQAPPPAASQAPNQLPDGSGQPPQGMTPEQQGERVADMQSQALGRQLSLAPPQIAKVKAILVARQRQMRETMAEPLTSVADRRLKLRQIQEDVQTRIETVLDPTQKQQFERMLAARRAHNRPLTAPGSPSARSAHGAPLAPGVHPAPQILTTPGPTPSPASPAPPPPAAAPAPPSNPQSK